MSKKAKRVSSAYAKRQFTTVGLVIILYILMAIYIPNIYYHLSQMGTLSFVRANPLFVVGGIYALVIIGTTLPFFILKSAFKIRFKDFWRPCRFGIGDLFVDLIVFIALGSALMFIGSIINSYLPIGEGLLLGIIFELPREYILSPLYGILFCLAIPIFEEIAYRGILLRSLGRYGNRFATFATAFIYALMQPSFSEFVPGFVLALFLINLTLRYRSVTPAIIIHILSNSFFYGIEFVPSTFINILTIILFVIYILAAIFIITHRYIYAKILRGENESYIRRLFYSRFSVIVALSMCILYALINNTVRF